MPRERGRKVVATNRKARHDYHIEAVFEAGLVLVGTEVKSLRAGRASLVDGYATVSAGEVWLENVHIPEYAQGTWTNHEPRRRRKLLLHRDEIDELGQQDPGEGPDPGAAGAVLQRRQGEGGTRSGPWQAELRQAPSAARTPGPARGRPGDVAARGPLTSERSGAALWCARVRTAEPASTDGGPGRLPRRIAPRPRPRAAGHTRGRRTGVRAGRGSGRRQRAGGDPRLSGRDGPEPRRVHAGRGDDHLRLRWQRAARDRQGHSGRVRRRQPAHPGVPDQRHPGLQPERCAERHQDLQRRAHRDQGRQPQPHRHRRADLRDPLHGSRGDQHLLGSPGAVLERDRRRVAGGHRRRLGHRRGAGRRSRRRPASRGPRAAPRPASTGSAPTARPPSPPPTCRRTPA